MGPALTKAYSSRRGIAARLSLQQGLTFASVGVALPFFPLWLSSRGLTEFEIGIILAIPIVCRVTAAASVAGLADGRIQPRLILAALNGLAVVFYGLLASQSDPWLIGAVLALSAVATAGIIPLVDSLTTSQVRAGVVDYGRVRLWGSISFFAANLAGGVLLARFGVGIVPVAIAGCFALAALSASCAPTPPNGMAPAATNTARGVRFGAAFWWTVLAFASINATHAALYAFGSLHWRRLGYGDEAIGGFWAVGVAAEILLFLYAGGIVARGAAGLSWMTVGAVAAALRFGLMAADPGPIGMVLLQALHGLSFGCLHLGTMAVISALAPDARRAAAQGHLTALSAFATGGATMLAGALFQTQGSLVFLAMTPLAVLGCVFVALANRKLRSDIG